MILLLRSFKQFARTPVTASVFFVLFIIASFFVTCGTVVWARTQATIKKYEDVFVTVGTVRQLPTHTEITDSWDADIEGYTSRSRPVYSAAVPLSVLSFDGAGYMHDPEKRPYYGAWRPDLKLLPSAGETHWRFLSNFVVEVAPLEDCLPSGPVEVRIVRVLNTVLPENQYMQLQPGEVIKLCDHYNDNPMPLYAGKTYLMEVRDRGPHSPSGHDGSHEYYPEIIAFSTQCRADGERFESDITYRSILEVDGAGHESGEMRLWLEYAANMNNAVFTIPVIPTAATHLLMPFYSGAAYIVHGEDIAEREYEDGERVCLISENFADMNGIGVGDMLRLPLYYADYNSTPAEWFVDIYNRPAQDNVFMWSIGAPLNAAGEPYQVFSDHEYEVKGIYANDTSGDYSQGMAVEMGANTVVVPASSIREDCSDNIIDYGPMKHATTSFEIPNGSIETFMENWLKSGGDDSLELEFHDRGYTTLQRGLENMKRASMLFLVIGLSLSLALAFYFCYMFISGNRLRTAVERMLGHTKWQCVISVLSSFLLAAFLAIAIGSVAALFADGLISELVTGQDYYDTMFTIGPLGEKAPEIDIVVNSALYAAAAGVALAIITALISAAFAHASIHKEPLKLLSTKNE